MAKVELLHWSSESGKGNCLVVDAWEARREATRSQREAKSFLPFSLARHPY